MFRIFTIAYFLFLTSATARVGTYNNAREKEATDNVKPIQRRQLEADDFVPLGCNSKLDTAICSSWSTRIGKQNVHTKRVTVQCGECVRMDHAGETIVFEKGLDIRGKLVFPDGYKIQVFSTMITVQGHLEMTATKGVDGKPAITFTMIGDDANLTMTPIGENKLKCNGGQTCPVGKKSITVAGGNVNSK